MPGEYSVCQFFSAAKNAPYEYVSRYVDDRQAVACFQRCTTSVGAQVGTARVIITDGSDSIVAEWKFGPGLVFPVQSTL